MKYLERAFPWLLLVPVILPVVIWNGLIFPYLVPKTLFFYAITFITVAVCILLTAYGRPSFISRLARWEAWVPGALLVLAYIASIAGIDFHQSFWSLFIRGDGLLMLTCAVASFYLVLLSADESFCKRLVCSAAIVGSFVAVYGIGEWVLGGGRIGSLLGNAAFFADYLALSFFATLVAVQMLRGNWRRAASCGAALQVVAIILTATRGTMLALSTALIAYIAYRAIFGEGRGRSWAAIALGAIVIGGGFFFAFRSELAAVPFEPIARIASISATEGDVASRLFIWQNMLGEIEKHSWLGVGAEHIDTLFNHFYDPTQISEQWFDRSHNAFLDYAAQYGIGGLLLYLALISAFFTTAFRLWRSGKQGIAVAAGLLALTYAAQNFFVFDTISSFWLLLALLAGLLVFSGGEEQGETIPFSRSAAWVAAAALLLLIIPVSIKPALAAYDLAQAYKYQLIDVTREVSYLSHGIALNTYGNLEYGYEAYDMYANIQVAQLTGDDRVKAYQAAAAILTENFNQYAYDARTAIYLAHVLSLAPAGTSVDSGLLSSALERAITTSSKRFQPWYILANLSISQANQYPAGSKERAAGYAAARDLLSRYSTLVSALAEPHFTLAQLLYASGDKAGAALEAEKGSIGYTSNLETAKRAAVYYENVLDLARAAFFLSEVVRLDPTNTAAKTDLEKIQSYEQSRK